MFEGGTSKNHNLIRKKIEQERDDFKNLINLVTDFSIMYLIKQIRSGVDIIKVFESWAGLLDKEDYNEFVIEPNERIKTAIKTSFPKIPIIFFRDSHPEIFTLY